MSVDTICFGGGIGEVPDSFFPALRARCAAMGVGAAVTGLTGFWAAIPVTMGVRALFDRYRSKTLTGKRVEGRIKRLQELNRFIRKEGRETETDLLPEETGAGTAVTAMGEIR